MFVRSTGNGKRNGSPSSCVQNLINSILKNPDQFRKRTAKERKILISSSGTEDDADPPFALCGKRRNFLLFGRRSTMLEK
jgi:hypothetical protein